MKSRAPEDQKVVGGIVEREEPEFLSSTSFTCMDLPLNSML